MPWSWSIAIECQFYLAAPGSSTCCLTPSLILDGERPVRVAGEPGSAALAHSRQRHCRHGLAALRQPPLCMRMRTRPRLSRSPGCICRISFTAKSIGTVFEYFNRIYDKPHGRFAPLLLGASLVAVEQQPALTRWMVSARRSARLPLALAGLLWGLSVGLTGYMTVCISGNRAFDLIALSTYRVLFSLAAAYVFLYVLAGRAHAQPSWLGRLLAARGWGRLPNLVQHLSGASADRTGAVVGGGGADRAARALDLACSGADGVRPEPGQRRHPARDD